MTFDKKALFNAILPKTKLVPVDGFGDVIVKQLDTEETDSIRAILKEHGDNAQFRFEMLVLSVVDDKGKAIFNTKDIPALKKSANAPIDSLITEVLKLNGFYKEATVKN
ncbi:hypothetical protein [Undibacterium aquatile]|uniref:Tail assembly chaperone n=1 Tax=Undibacterium aquatile TaxID=1537398 RepID=A0ABR6XEP9_9BURK|nr:hypothetical protein [Undibacterium aquatile]MBC3811331.1 hypothetical protein [Undibacterium aquatile]